MRLESSPSPKFSSLNILHTESSLGWGGQEIRILTEAAGMIQRGFQVRLLSPPEATIYKAAPKWGVPVEGLPIARKNMTGLLALRHRLANSDADVIITHSSTDSWLTAVASLFLRRPPPMVRLRHLSTPVPTNFPTRWLYGTASRLVITTGEGIRQRLIDVNGLPADHLLSIPTGIDLKRFSPGDQNAARLALNLPIGIPMIGIVATLRSWKGHIQLVEAFSAIQNQKAMLVIVGDGPFLDTIQKRLVQLDIPPDRVRMPGSQENIPEWLQALDLFVLPSYANEGVPQALIQAMACGLPVISTPVGGIPEMIDHGRTGILTPAKDSIALAKAIDDLLDNPQKCRQLGQAALIQAREKGSLDGMLDRMVEALSGVIKRH
ncbi:MAG: glycosyltransferase family 4 protein [Magnetococcus sp. DMHC-6]